MKIIKNSGIHLISDDLHLTLDPKSVRSANEADLVLISHAHTDHYPKSLKNVKPLKILSRATFLLLSPKNGGQIPNCKIIRPYQEARDEIQFGKHVRIRAYPAGHVIGSLQFLIKIRDEKIIYTGDFCLADRFGMEKSPILKARDGTLIIDETYYKEGVSFPPRKKIYTDILRWLNAHFKKSGKRSAVVIAQRLGTCQEISALINYSTLKNVRIHAHPQVFESNMIHSTFSKIRNFFKRNVFEEEQRNTRPNQTSLSKFLNSKQESRESATIDSKGHNKPQSEKVIYLLPFHYVRKTKELVDFYGSDSVAVCTGWVMTKMFSNLGKYGINLFPLTSHAGYDEVQRYIRESQSRKVVYV